jgi:uncharacterized protein (TIGR03083 family)
MSLDYLGFVRSESARFAAALAEVDASAPVPSCPEWTATDLLWHLAEVQLFWGAIVRERLSDPDDAEKDKPERPDDYVALREVFDRASKALVDALESTPDDVAVWTWFDADQSVGFIRRRQAHEALIHRLDAELTARAAFSEIDPGLATDGVREVLDWMYSGYPAWAEHRLDGPVGRIATTDTGAEWSLQIGHWSGHSPNSGKDYTDQATLTLIDQCEPTFEIRGAAGDVDAWLWNRPPSGPVEVSGLAGPFEAVIRQGVQ